MGRILERKKKKEKEKEKEKERKKESVELTRLGNSDHTHSNFISSISSGSGTLIGHVVNDDSETQDGVECIGDEAGVDVDEGGFEDSIGIHGEVSHISGVSLGGRASVRNNVRVEVSCSRIGIGLGDITKGMDVDTMDGIGDKSSDVHGNFHAL